MLSEETTRDPNAVQALICEPMDVLPRVELSQEGALIFTSLFMTNNEGATEFINRIKKDKEGRTWLYLYNILINRAGFYPFKIEARAAAFMSLSGVAENAASIVMYLAYLLYKCAKHQVQVVTLERIQEWFAEGFFKESDLRQLWYKTKVKVKGTERNLLDYGTAYASMVNRSNPVTVQPNKATANV